VAVRVMREAVGEEVAARLEPYRGPGERVAVVGGDLWLSLAHGVSTSRLASAATPARTGGAGTFRNWNTGAEDRGARVRRGWRGWRRAAAFAAIMSAQVRASFLFGARAFARTRLLSWFQGRMKRKRLRSI
jgi:hypothetical protein